MVIPAKTASALILCTCEGKISKRIDPLELAALLKKREIHVVIADKLCEDWTSLESLINQSRPASLVIGACSDESFLSNLREKLNTLNFADSPTGTFDLLTQSTLDLNEPINARLTALLLESQLEKTRRFPGISQDNLKTYWFRNGEKLSRRRLFSVLRIRHDIIPSVEKEKCLAWKGCYLCIAACPQEATLKEEGSIRIDKDKCTGCGACIAPCPTRCIIYPGSTYFEIEAQIETLLFSNGVLSTGVETVNANPARVIAFVCSQAQDIFREFLLHHKSFAEYVLPVSLPCLVMASPYLIIKTLSMGASSVLLFFCREGCPKGIEPGKILENIKAAQSLVESLGIEHKILHHVNQESLSDIAEKIKNVIKERKTPALPTIKSKHGEAGGNLGSIMAGLGTDAGKRGIYKLDSVKVPLGKVKIDPEVCSFCELCTNYCPAGALKLEKTEDTSSIVFNHRECVDCKLCVKICPERKNSAIKVEKVLDWDSLCRGSQEVLVNSKLIRCTECGTPIGTSLMIDRIKKQLGPEATTAFDLCSQCRFKVALFRDKEIPSGDNKKTPDEK